MNKFSSLLDDIIWPTEKQIIEENWNISGILKNFSNENLKFDVRPMVKIANNLFEKRSKLSNKADKIVFETSNKWIIVDNNELKKYILHNKINVVHIDDLIKNLEWNKFINKDT